MRTLSTPLELAPMLFERPRACWPSPPAGRVREERAFAGDPHKPRGRTEHSDVDEGQEHLGLIRGSPFVVCPPAPPDGISGGHATRPRPHVASPRLP